MTDADRRLRMAMDSHKVMDDFDPVVEIVKGMVAKLVHEGFTEEQAREIVTAIFRTHRSPETAR